MKGWKIISMIKVFLISLIFSVSIFLFVLFALHWHVCSSVSFWLASWGHNSPLQGIPHSTHENSTKQVLERCKGVLNTQQQSGEFEVDEKDYDTKVDQWVRSLDVVESLTQKYDGCYKTCFCHAEKVRKYEG